MAPVVVDRDHAAQRGSALAKDVPVLWTSDFQPQELLHGMWQIPENCLKSNTPSPSKFESIGENMRRQYLHLSAHRCGECRGPVVSGSLAVRENEISKETDIREIGAICISCGRREKVADESRVVRQFPPIEWVPA